ncbi:MAG: phosphoenolpyruvate synthase/pyruvate phosphate dikinase [Proteobacteria bacterium]|nr:phosphoenolpyruvate synthase/pyruvate phosphate dikinase [Pseudomonadota bacterium]MBU1687720.1 phosphoenolpyruvate synthase/pyruvate phosphate dikinase [Pseudomonadota bacterium]
MEPIFFPDLEDLEADFKIYRALMRRKVHEILLVFSPYDAFIVEESGSLAARIVREYHGLNLSNPPRMTQVATGGEALKMIRTRSFDLVITMPMVDDMDGFALGRAIKSLRPKLPVILLSHQLRGIESRPEQARSVIDDLYIWEHDPDLLLALIKNLEDRWNVSRDTRLAKVRVLLLVEDSPRYRSYFLALIYKEVVRQTQAVLDESLTEQERLLRMRARPKILVAENHEEALVLVKKFRPYLHGVIADTRFPRGSQLDSSAGIDLLTRLRKVNPDLPLLLLSVEPGNQQAAHDIPAVFLDKNSPDLARGLHDFFLNHLGFGDFVFRDGAGQILGKADSIHAFERLLSSLPDESLIYHAERNHFSNWIMARSEVKVASWLRDLKLADFPSVAELRTFLVSLIHGLRRVRQRGSVINFSEADFDPEVTDFVVMGEGLMGGKALGLAFMASQLRHREIPCGGSGGRIRIPRTCVITIDYFDQYIEANDLRRFQEGGDDEAIQAAFLLAPLPENLIRKLQIFLDRVDFPLSVRSSSITEDAQFRPYAGLYATCMLANNESDPKIRFGRLQDAIRLVYASAYGAGPISYRHVLNHVGRDGMGIIIQELVGRRWSDFWYPAISGVAMSYNYYPMAKMKPEEGVAQIALGFGKTVVDGEQSLRFSPHYPEVLPQFSSVDDILANSQRFFYALDMRGGSDPIRIKDSNLSRRPVAEALDDQPVKLLTSTYLPDEHRIRDTLEAGPRVLTFAQLLKYDSSLGRTIIDLLEEGRKGLGCAVEIEFALELDNHGRPWDFCFLQIRPLAAGIERGTVRISPEESERAVCRTDQALGHGIFSVMADIIWVRPETFQGARTREIAQEISRLNNHLQQEKRPYLLIGPGRWGSLDPLLGIPVQWQDIAGVGVMIELRNEILKVDPSQGSHFFQNITSLGIPYLTVTEGHDHLDGEWLTGLPVECETRYLRHYRLSLPLTMKVDGNRSLAVILVDEGRETSFL